jgi:hypothetical protein
MMEGLTSLSRCAKLISVDGRAEFTEVKCMGVTVTTTRTIKTSSFELSLSGLAKAMGELQDEGVNPYANLEIKPVGSGTPGRFFFIVTVQKTEQKPPLDAGLIAEEVRRA